MGKRIIEIPVEPGDVVYAIMGDRIMAVPVEMVYVNITQDGETRASIWGNVYFPNPFYIDGRRTKESISLSLNESRVYDRAYLTREEAEAVLHERAKEKEE